jgi:hypothetical protein
MNEFIEQQITDAVKKLLAEKVNELLGELQYNIPLVEFGNYKGSTVVVPVISLASCERTEKERIILQDAYSITITFNVPETQESELFCYAYSNAVNKAVQENPTLNGIADRTVITANKYTPPKKADCGQEWELIFTLRVTVEGMKV